MVLCAGMPAGAQGTSDRRLDAANGFLGRGLYEEAVLEYESFLETTPTGVPEATARYGLGVALFRLGRIEPALAQLDRIRADSGFGFEADAEVLRGHARMRLGAYARAAEHFRTIVERHPDHASAADAGALLVESTYRAGALEDASRHGDAVARRWPEARLIDRVDLFSGLARLGLEQHEQAAERFERVVRRGEDGELLDQAQLLLARSLDRAQNAEAARRGYRAVLRRGVPTYVPEALLGLSRLVAADGNPGEAENLLVRLVTQFEDVAQAPAAWYELGRIQLDKGAYADAREALANAAEADADRYTDHAAYWIGKSHLREGRPERAAGVLGEALERGVDPALRAETSFDYGVALLRSERHADAAEHFGSWLETHPEHELGADALYSQALATFRDERYGEALPLGRAFLERFGEHRLSADAALVAGESAYLAGDYESAQLLLDRSERLGASGAQLAQARYRRGMALYRLDRLDEAEPLLTEAAGSNDEAFRQAWLALGDGAFRTERWRDAERALGAYAVLGDDAPNVDDAVLKLGLARARQGKQEEAIAAFEALIDGFETSVHLPQGVFELGQSQLELGRLDAARETFGRVVDEHGQTRFAPYAMRHLGVIASRQGDPSEAARWFAMAQERGDGALAVSAALERGRSLLGAGAYREAADVLEPLTDAGTDDDVRSKALVAYATALSRVGEHDGAIEAADTALRDYASTLDAGRLDAVRYERAWALRQVDRVDDAASAYAELEADVSGGTIHAHALLDLAALEMGRDRHDAAMPVLERLNEVLSGAVDVGGEVREQAAYRTGACALKLERHAEVRAALANFHERWPDSELVRSAELMCAEAEMKLGRNADAADRLERLVASEPDAETLEAALLRLGDATVTLQQWSRAERAYRVHLSELPESDLWFRARFGLGWSYENQGRHDEAIEQYREVVARHKGPTAARSQFQIGECLYAKRAFEEAVRELLKVDILYAYPEWSAAALFEAGKCFEELGRVDDAREQYRRVAEHYAESDWAAMSRQRLDAIATRPVPRGRSGS